MGTRGLAGSAVVERPRPEVWAQRTRPKLPDQGRGKVRIYGNSENLVSVWVRALKSLVPHHSTVPAPSSWVTRTGSGAGGEGAREKFRGAFSFL